MTVKVDQTSTVVQPRVNHHLNIGASRLQNAGGLRCIPEIFSLGKSMEPQTDIVGVTSTASQRAPMESQHLGVPFTVVDTTNPNDAAFRHANDCRCCGTTVWCQTDGTDPVSFCGQIGRASCRERV